MGARAEGMGNASGCLGDVWALTNNIAGLAKVTNSAAGFSYNAIPSAPFFDRMAAVFALPLKPGVAGMGVFRFGDDLYNEHVLSAAFANTFGLASLGIKVNYVQYQASGLDATGALTVSFGGITSLTPQLHFGAHILNINQPVIDRSTEERAPTKLHTTIAFVPSSKLTVAAEIEKDLRYPPILKAGIEYQAVKKISFRSGFNLRPQAGFFGFGFSPRKFSVGYALQLNRVFGITHQATITYRLKRS